MKVCAEVTTALDGDVVVDFANEEKALAKSVKRLHHANTIHVNHAYPDAIRALWKRVLAKSGCCVREVHLNVTELTRALSRGIADTILRPDSPVRTLHISSYHADPCPKEVIAGLAASPIERIGVMGWNRAGMIWLIRTLVSKPGAVRGLSISYCDIDDECIDGICTLVASGRISELTLESLIIEDPGRWSNLGQAIGESTTLKKLSINNCSCVLINAISMSIKPDWTSGLEEIRITGNGKFITRFCTMFTRFLPPSVRVLDFNCPIQDRVIEWFHILPIERIRRFQEIRLTEESPLLTKRFVEALSGPNELRKLSYGFYGINQKAIAALSEALRSRHCHLEEFRYNGREVPREKFIRAYRLNPIPVFVFGGDDVSHVAPELHSEWLRVLRTLLSVTHVPRISTKSSAATVPFHDLILKIATTLGWPLYTLQT
jgi:hypothetical protein